jgi:hypothetical protein
MIQARDCELSLVFDLQLPLSFTYNCFIFFLCLPKERNEESAPCRKPSGCAGTPTHKRQSLHVGGIHDDYSLPCGWIAHYSVSELVVLKMLNVQKCPIGAVLRLAFVMVDRG